MFFSKTKIVTLTMLLFSTLPSLAAVTHDESNAEPSASWWNRFVDDVKQTWHSSPDRDFYLPVITWHNRWTYDQYKIDHYNERPWGAGYGMSRFDGNGNWHAIYIMAFKDSFNKWEPFSGYAYEKIWRPTQDNNFRLGLGYTVGVTARDNWSYVPVPALVPLASIGYQRFTFQATYIPGTHNNGNVLFAWFRWQL
ncbi:lipid IV(A) palmitoyltransferase PagP [Serratia microhaemolytica]|uniref:lipid IV(A) palmitoyltransferase PagP n=1 Tax=Serratia microhaemolytica TaxID=2675110 RepID=UPI001F0C75FA|nr:lipid IV(A) palmitoyltransferase PagP [Serratia microhaemolytica]